MQNRVDYSVEMRFTAANTRCLHHAGTLVLGAARPPDGEVTACGYGEGTRVDLHLVCRQVSHGRVRISGQARLSGGPDAAPDTDRQAFAFELAPGETRPCTLRVRAPGGALAPAPGADIRLRVGNVVLGGDPGGSIAARAAALGPGLTGAAVSGCEAVPGGHRVRYRHADVYFSPATGAHELYGAVRDKYGALGGPGGDLGLPLTGVRPTPDGQGRCAHFAGGGSVYWHPTTGPMALRGALRAAWDAAGGERGPLGYPTSDELTTAQQPWRRYATFQNGVLFGGEDGRGALVPALAGLGAEGVRAALDRAWRRVAGAAGGAWPGTAALVDVSPTRADFRRSGGRVLTFRLTGEPEAEPGPGSPPGPVSGVGLPLLFEAVPSPEDPGRTLLRARQSGAALFHAGGPDPQRTAQRLRGLVAEMFGRPLILFEVPEAAGFLALTVLPGGALSLAFRPDVLGRLAAQAAQGQLDALEF